LEDLPALSDHGTVRLDSQPLLRAEWVPAPGPIEALQSGTLIARNLAAACERKKGLFSRGRSAARLSSRMNDDPGERNYTGHPAITLPCAKSNGLPIGMQLVGRKFAEATLLRTAICVPALRRLGFTHCSRAAGRRYISVKHATG